MDDFGLPLYSDQQKVYDEAAGHDYWGLFCDVGTGKTAILLKLLTACWDHRSHVCIVCPRSVREVWLEEAEKFAPQLIKYMQIISGTAKKRFAQVATRDKLIHIQNFETIVSMNYPPGGYAYIIVDESHFIKNRSAKRTKALIKLGKGSRYRWIASATPVTNNWQDIFSQFLFLDQGERLGKNFYAFRNEFFYDRNMARKGTQNYYPDLIIRPGAEETLLTKIRSCTSRLKLKINTPQVWQKHYYQPAADQMKAYKEMAEDYLTYVNGQAVTATIALTKIIRLQQILSGFAIDEDGKLIRFKSNSRLKECMELLDTLTINNKVIVWGRFTYDLDQIYKRCEEQGFHPARCYKNHNNVSDRHRFRDDPGCRVLVANTASGGTGLTIICARIALYYNDSFQDNPLQTQALLVFFVHPLTQSL